MLLYHKIDNENITTSCQVRPMEEKRITNLESGMYRFCLFNSYMQDADSLTDDLCQIVKITSSKSAVSRSLTTNVDENGQDLVVVDGREVSSSSNIQMIVAVLCSAAGLVIVCLLLGAFLWRKRRFLHLKNS